MNKLLLGAVIVAAFVAGTITTSNFTFAAPPPDLDEPKPLDKILILLTDPIFGLEEMKEEVSNIEETVTDISGIKTETDKIQMVKDDVGAIKTETDKIPMIKTDVGAIKTETDKIQMVKDDVSDLASLQYVPFIEHIPGGTCDQAGDGETRNRLRIESVDGKPFIISELNIFVEGAKDAGDSLSVDIAGVQTGNIITIPQTIQMINFLGLPALFNSGTTPTLLNSDLNDNIIIFVTCNAGAANDMSLTNVNSLAWGWKQVGDDIDNSFSVVPP